jgi:hypothetical protein
VRFLTSEELGPENGGSSSGGGGGGRNAAAAAAGRTAPGAANPRLHGRKDPTAGEWDFFGSIYDPRESWSFWYLVLAAHPFIVDLQHSPEVLSHPLGPLVFVLLTKKKLMMWSCIKNCTCTKKYLHVSMSYSLFILLISSNKCFPMSFK